YSRRMTAFILAAAIASEVIGTLALKASDGFTRPVPATIVVVGYGVAFWLLALVLKHLSVGTTYAIWSAVGTAAIALIGMVAYCETSQCAQARLAGPYRARRDRAECRRRALKTDSSTPPGPSCAATVRRRSRSTPSRKRPACPRAGCCTTSAPSAS